MERFTREQSESSREKTDVRAEFLAADQTRLEQLRNFIPTGDFEKDTDEFLSLAGHGNYLGLDRTTALKGIREFLNQTLDPSLANKRGYFGYYVALREGEPGYEWKYLHYREIPRTEIAVIDAILAHRSGRIFEDSAEESPKAESGRESTERPETSRKQRLEQLRGKVGEARELLAQMEQEIGELDAAEEVTER